MSGQIVRTCIRLAISSRPIVFNPSLPRLSACSVNPKLPLRFYQTSNDGQKATKEEEIHNEKGGKGEEETSGEEGSKADNQKDLKDWSQEELVAEFTKLKETCEKAEEEAKSLKNKLAYALADIDNVRKISRKDVSNAREFALKDFGKDLLDVVENCERAISLFPEECKQKGHPMAGIFVGLEMTANVMLKVFEKHGLARIPVEPKQTVFDPNLHDALFQQPVAGLPAGIIFSIVKSGWTLNGRVLRAAQVGVSADPPEEEAPAAEAK